MKKVHAIYLLIFFSLTLVGCSKVEGKSKGDNFLKPAKENYIFESGKDIEFYVATDVHYLSDSLIKNGKAFDKYVFGGDGKQLDYIDEVFDALSYTISNANPQALIISGDLTNNGEKQSHLDLSKKLKAIEKSGTSVYVIPGNHDISNPWSRGFDEDKQYVTDTIDQNEFRTLYRDFGYNEAFSRDKNTLSYLATPSEDIWLLMIDTNQYERNYTLGYPQTDGVIGESTIKWIKDCISLANEKGAKILPVMHHSSLTHNEVIRDGFTLNNSSEITKIFKDNNIEATLSGHIHIQDITSDKSDEGTLYDIATGSLSLYPHKFGVLNYSPTNDTFEYSTSSVDVDTWAKDLDIKDETLNNFEEYSSNFFAKFAYNMAYKNLTDHTNSSQADIELMAETMKLLNLNYFAGLDNLISEDIINSEGFKLLSTNATGFLSRYLKSITNDNDTDDNYLYIK